MHIHFERPGVAARQWNPATGQSLGTAKQGRARPSHHVVCQLLSNGARRGQLPSANRNEVRRPRVLVETVVARVG